MKKVKFVNLGLYGQFFTINTNYYNLKSYYNYSGKNQDKVQWLESIISDVISVDEAVDEIVADNPDILCLSFFVWNHERTLLIGCRIKEKFPNIKIVAGGPNLDAHKNPNFFNELPFVDYVAYGDGEQALTEIIDSIVENRHINSGNKNAVNIVTREKIYPHKVFDDKIFFDRSIILESQADILNDIKKMKATTPDRNIIFRYERARGCPYKCSFCDWSQGLHNKVKRRTNSWKEEIDFLVSLGVIMTPTDANWGFFKEDLEIVEYITKIHGRFYIGNVPKLNKKVAFDLYKIIFKNSDNAGRSLKLSFQDINENVLENIDRPDVPWEEQKKYILDFHKEFPHVSIKAEIILGLPGQTVENFINQIVEFEKAKIDTLHIYFWEILKNSPAGKQEYQDKFAIKHKKFVIVDMPNKFENIDQIIAASKTGEAGLSHSSYVIENYSMSYEDIVTCVLISQLWNYVKKAGMQKYSIKKVIDTMLPAIKEKSREIAEFSLQHGVIGILDNSTNRYKNLLQYLNNSNEILSLYKRFITR